MLQALLLTLLGAAGTGIGGLVVVIQPCMGFKRLGALQVRLLTPQWQRCGTDTKSTSDVCTPCVVLLWGGGTMTPCQSSPVARVTVAMSCHMYFLIATFGFLRRLQKAISFAMLITGLKVLMMS